MNLVMISSLATKCQHFKLGGLQFLYIKWLKKGHFNFLICISALINSIFFIIFQDVVYALAHATGKTGRFTLIERWRNNERLLAPQEHPLKVIIHYSSRSRFEAAFICRKHSFQTKTRFHQNQWITQCPRTDCHG